MQSLDKVVDKIASLERQMEQMREDNRSLREENRHLKESVDALRHEVVGITRQPSSSSTQLKRPPTC